MNKHWLFLLGMYVDVIIGSTSSNMTLSYRAFLVWINRENTICRIIVGVTLGQHENGGPAFNPYRAVILYENLEDQRGFFNLKSS